MNNAHASRQKPLIELSAEDWALSFGTGFNATLNFMKAAYPELKKAEGSVVNFGSGAALDGQSGQASYAAAKEAIRGLSRVAATEWGVDKYQNQCSLSISINRRSGKVERKQSRTIRTNRKAYPFKSFW